MKKLFILLNFSFLSATVINVPGDQVTIQAGIDASAEGDTVLVQPGTYYENINFNGKNIVLMSQSGPENTNIESGATIYSENGTVVTFENNENESAQLIGFTITGGASEYNGGGISVYNASPILKNLIVRDNYAGYSVAWDAGGNGGGISLVYSNTQIFNTSITGNQTAGGWGWNGVGGGVYFRYSNVTLKNVFIGNNQSGHGGGIYSDNSMVSLLNCTVSDNDAMSGLLGSEITEYSNGMELDNSTMTVTNSIFWGSDTLQDIILTDSDITIRYSDIQGGWKGEGNIDANPLFLDPDNGNYHLQPDSPCIDAGDPDSPPDPNGTVADMGAFYFDQNNTEDPEVTLEFGEVDMNNRRLEILITNTVDVYGLQFDIIGDVNLSISAGTNPPGWSFSTNGTTVLIFSITGDMIPAGEGTLLWLNYEISDVTEICFGPVIVSGFQGTPLDTATGDCITVYPPCLDGDLNGDGQIDVLDIVQMVDCILNGTNECPCSDVNGDGTVDVLDIVEMVGMILEG